MPRIILILVITLCYLTACQKPALSTLPVYNRPNINPLWLTASALNSDTIHGTLPLDMERLRDDIWVLKEELNQ